LKNKETLMTNKELVQTGMKAWEANDADTLSPLVAEDFVMSGPTPQPLGKGDFIGFMHILLAALPDFAFNISRYEENGDTIVAYSHITGTHMGPLALPGLPPIPATGKKVALPEEVQTYTVKNGKLQSLVTDARPDAGVAGMLAQLGVALPQ
jgi:predicted ester cyclase